MASVSGWNSGKITQHELVYTYDARIPVGISRAFAALEISAPTRLDDETIKKVVAVVIDRAVLLRGKSCESGKTKEQLQRELKTVLDDNRITFVIYALAGSPYSNIKRETFDEF